MLSLFRRAMVGREGAEPTGAAPAPPAAGFNAGPDVVIIDDSPGLRNMVGQIVGKAGLTHVTAASLDDVDALKLGGSASLALLDLSLERSDAIDVLRHLATIGFTGPIVLMSGQDLAVLDYLTGFGRQLGLKMRPPLQKPFRADALRTILGEKAAGPGRHVAIDFDEVLARGQLEVWYQPRVELSSFKIAGFEALVRIRHPQEGLLLPGRFLGQLSDRDMANLTAQVLKGTITTWEKLAEAGFVLKPSMNVRARELLSPSLIETLKDNRPDDPRWSGLVMELTEPKLVDEVEAAREAVVRLQLHKVQLALDDFGAVASGLVRCPELRLSEVGVDRRFVNGCARDPDRLAVCKAAVAFASRTRMRVVAEGVEAVEDMQAVRALGFDWAQGNLFSKPLPYELLNALLRKGRPLWGALEAGHAA